VVDPIDSHEDYSSLRENVSLLGHILGETIANAQGENFLGLIERIRGLSKGAREGLDGDREALLSELRSLSNDQLIPVARAFAQFLNLANIADQQHMISRELDPVLSASQNLEDGLQALAESGVSARAIYQAAENLKIELVLTAHPTEITRRTVIHKHGEIGRCLSQMELSGLTERERRRLQWRLRELVAQIWYGDDFRTERPTPVDEAKWGFAVVEESLWWALPEFLRRLDTCVEKYCGERLPLEIQPVSFVSWMGGDRDGNPNVTAEVTREVLLLSRWQALDLYLRDISRLMEELSMTHCSQELNVLAAGAHEPYRAVLHQVRDLLQRSRQAIEAELKGEPTDLEDLLCTPEQLWQPLYSCYRSLLDCGMDIIARGELLDLLRRVRCFGIHLVQLDIRQDSSRHTQLMSELTTHLDLGDYADWDEAQRCEFLLRELGNRRPLIPSQWQPTEDVQEVLDTLAVVASQPQGALGAYVISMARQASDVLAVELLLKEAGLTWNMPVVPLFETLDDLSRARSVIETLLKNDWFRAHIGGQLMVMIGYSDSSKDAGTIAASWAQYRAQEELLQVCGLYGVQLTLFHGRGGTIGRGGAPAREALLSQPPGSLENGLRVTEQGEMIRTKLGWPSLAVKTLALYTVAICQANLTTPPAPNAQWRDVMDRLAEESCAAYRKVVRDEPDFVPYFRHATPEQELASLPLGSRPARRRGGGGIESLRAIPWIFAWSQNRLMLPAWLGAGEALALAVQRGEQQILREMADLWPFFDTRLSMLEMVFAKSDSEISAYYDALLVPNELRDIGDRLRQQLRRDRDTILAIQGSEQVLEDNPWGAESIRLRNIYTDPLNFLQAELLQRNRQESLPEVERAIMVTIAGISAGMRNTG
jgi:phosphoenolpyruvate carboxylase